MKPILPIIMLFALTSCLIDYDEENFVEVPQNIRNSVPLDIEYSYGTDEFLPMESDTLFKYQNASLILRFNYSDISWLEIYIDDDSIPLASLDQEETAREFIFPDTGEGLHQVTLVEYYQTGSGSLADVLNSEFSIQSSLFLIKEEQELSNLKNIEVQYDSGYAILRWDKYLRSDFQNYSLNGENIVDPHQNYYVLPQALIPADYSLSLKRGGIETLQVKLEGFTEDYVPNFNVVEIDDFQGFMVAWDLPKAYKGISALTLSISEAPSGEMLTSEYIDDIFSSETLTILKDLYFGRYRLEGQISFELDDGSESIVYLDNEEFYVDTGSITKSANSITYSSTKNQLYLGTYETIIDYSWADTNLANSILVVDGTSFIPIDTLDIQYPRLLVSSDEFSIFGFTNTERLDLGYGFFQYNLNSWQEMSNGTILKVGNNNSIGYRVDYSKVSANNKIFAKYGIYSYVADLNSQEVFEYDKGEIDDISNDGVYFVDQFGIFAFENPNEAIYSHKKMYDWLRFQPNTNNLVCYYLADYQIDIVDYSSGHIIMNFQLPYDKDIEGYDEKSNSIFYTDADSFYAFEVNTPESIVCIPVRDGYEFERDYEYRAGFLFERHSGNTIRVL